jgi:hypothetical protein
MNSATRTPEQEYRELYEKMARLCDRQGWGDPFSYARSKEIYAATVLGHQVAKDFSGADAIDNGEECQDMYDVDRFLVTCALKYLPIKELKRIFARYK